VANEDSTRPSFSTMRWCEMVWSIIRAKSYVRETSKSLKAVELQMTGEHRASCRRVRDALLNLRLQIQALLTSQV
jgi:hypothetical protein